MQIISGSNNAGGTFGFFFPAACCPPHCQQQNSNTLHSKQLNTNKKDDREQPLRTPKRARSAIAEMVVTKNLEAGGKGAMSREWRHKCHAFFPWVPTTPLRSCRLSRKWHHEDPQSTWATFLRPVGGSTLRCRHIGKIKTSPRNQTAWTLIPVS